MRTESSEINVPAELIGKKFKITNIWIHGSATTVGNWGFNDNLLVGLILGGKSLLMGSNQTFNEITTTLDMLPVPITVFLPGTTQVIEREAYYTLLSELFNNIKKIKIVYSLLQTGANQFKIQITIGGVIL